MIHKPSLFLRALFLLECLLVSLIPGVETVILLRAILNKDISQFVPNAYSDQVYYWHEITTFRQAGLNGGYYAPDEQIPSFSLSHSDAVGPFFTLIYSGIARITGWDGATAILINITLLALGILAFIALARLNPVQVAVTGLLCLTFSPLLLYVPTIFQESFHQMGAFMLAGLFYRLISDKSPKRWVLGAAFLLLVILSLVRISWAMFFVPLFVLTLPRKWKYMPVAVVLALVVGFALFEVVGLTSAPSNNSVTRILGEFRESPVSGLKAIRSAIRSNIHLSKQYITINQVAFYQQIIYLGVLALAVGWLVWALWRRWKRQPVSLERVDENLFHLYNLGLLFIATYTLYIVAGEIRVMSAHLLFSLLLLLAFRRWKFAPVLAAVAVFLLSAPVFIKEYRQWNLEYMVTPQMMQTGQAVVQKVIQYQPDAPSPWCNTVLLPVTMYDYRVLFFPPGIGIAYIQYENDGSLRKDFRLPPKSRYLLMNEDGLQSLTQAWPVRLRLLAELPEGQLYYNEDTPCEGPEN